MRARSLPVLAPERTGLEAALRRAAVRGEVRFDEGDRVEPAAAAVHSK